MQREVCDGGLPSERADAGCDGGGVVWGVGVWHEDADAPDGREAHEREEQCEGYGGDAREARQ